MTLDDSHGLLTPLAEVIDAALSETPQIGCRSAAELKRRIESAVERSTAEPPSAASEEAAPSGGTVTFTVTKGMLKGTQFTVPDTCWGWVGRTDECTIRLPDPGVSRRHCEINLTGSWLGIRDMNSKNGTWIDGRCIGSKGNDYSEGQYYPILDHTRLGLGNDCELLITTSPASLPIDGSASINLPERDTSSQPDDESSMKLVTVHRGEFPHYMHPVTDASSDWHNEEEHLVSTLLGIPIPESLRIKWPPHSLALGDPKPQSATVWVERPGTIEFLPSSDWRLSATEPICTIPRAVSARNLTLHYPHSLVSNITSDGRVIGCNEHAVWFLATPDGKHVRRFAGHLRNRRSQPGSKAQISSVVLSDDLRWGLSAGDDSTVRLWCIATGELLRTFRLPTASSGERSWFMKLAGFLPPNMVFGLPWNVEREGFAVWDINSGEMLAMELRDMDYDHPEQQFSGSVAADYWDSWLQEPPIRFTR